MLGILVGAVDQIINCCDLCVIVYLETAVLNILLVILHHCLSFPNRSWCWRESSGEPWTSSGRGGYYVGRSSDVHEITLLPRCGCRGCRHR